jgi:hypothetical protein
MNIQDFKTKTVSVLNKNFEKSGKIGSVFLYVTPSREFKAVGMDNFANDSKEYVSLFLKELTKEKMAVYTAYITNNIMTEMTQKDMEGFLATGDSYIPEDNTKEIKVVSLEINSATERIALNFRIVDDVNPRLQMISEIKSDNNKRIANLI